MQIDSEDARCIKDLIEIADIEMLLTPQMVYLKRKLDRGGKRSDFEEKATEIAVISSEWEYMVGRTY